MLQPWVPRSVRRHVAGILIHLPALPDQRRRYR
jgi:hypothetical protein